ncbi:MAG: DUF1292 domain-containing protein [Clostridia bacterium]|nr:DUF1292 domain-containing protein [Clostridia bacterium]
MEDYGPDIISVLDDDGVEHEFEVLDRIDTDDKSYVALIPYYENEADMLNDDGELIILRVAADDEMLLEPIEDEEEFDRIGRQFEERLADTFDFSDEEE